MKQEMHWIRNTALALCVVGALVFGATQAMAYTTCVTCDPDPEVECAAEQFPDLFCEWMCVREWDCFGGECHEGDDECRCYYK